MRWTSIPRLPAAALAFLIAGTVSPLMVSADPWRNRIWFAGLLLTGIPVAWRTFTGVLRGEFAADVVAMFDRHMPWRLRGRPEYANFIAHAEQVAGRSLTDFFATWLFTTQPPSRYP